ncbi:PilZ domain-containing protein [Acidobacteria bacterium AH-259-L09]|nr:PilZ domain-containing protein [Acidobacteria bacterium AH-259-L09]
MKLYQVLLPVSDIEQAESFYSQLLEMPGRRVSPGRHHFECGELILTCYDPGAEGEQADVSPNPQPLYFTAEDLEAAFEWAKDAGCTSLDDEIVTQPWGDRSFSVKDPFGNPIRFVDETTTERQRNEQITGGPDDSLKIGLALSIESTKEGSQKKQLAASIFKIFKDEIWLKLSKSSAEPVFEEGEGVRVQYGDEEGVYVADVEIIKVPSENQHVAISMPKEVNMLQRRAAPRVRFEIPISFSIVGTAEGEGEVFKSRTRDISTGGLRFETSAQLEAGEKVKISLLLPPSEKISVAAKVMSSEHVTRENKVLTSVGAQFIELQLDDQIKILQFLIDSQSDEEAEK